MVRQGLVAAALVLSVGLGGTARAHDPAKEAKEDAKELKSDVKREAREAKRDVKEEADDWERSFDRDRMRSSRRDDVGYSVRVNGGVGNFTGDLNSHTRTGPVWGVAVRANAMKLVEGEIGYEGSRHGIDTTRLISDDAAIWRNGVSAMAMLAPQVTDNLKPYVGAGLGLDYINPNEPAEIAYRTDFIQEIPLAAGVDLSAGPLTAGVRATYRVLFGEEFAENVSSSTEGGLFTTTLNVGGRF
jgi:hypothetical protein